MKKYIIILGVAFVAVCVAQAHASPVDPKSVNAAETALKTGFTQACGGVWRNPHPDKAISYEMNEGSTRTPRGIWYRIFSHIAAGKWTSQFVAEDPDRITYGGSLAPGTTSLDEDTLFTLMGYTGTPSGIWYKIAPREALDESANVVCTVVGPNGRVYKGDLPFGTTTPDEATLFEKIMGYTRTPSGIWYKIVPRRGLDESVNVCTVLGPEGRAYTGILPSGTTSPDEATLFQIMGVARASAVDSLSVNAPEPGTASEMKMESSSVIEKKDEQISAGIFKLGFTQEPSGVWSKPHPDKAISCEIEGATRTPRGIWYRIFSNIAAGKWTSQFVAEDPDRITYGGSLAPGTTSLDEDTLFTLMGYTGTPSGIWYKIAPREALDESANVVCTVVGPNGRVYKGDLPFGTTTPDEATLFEKIMGYTRTPSGIWYKIVPRRGLDESVNVCTVLGPKGRAYTGILPSGTTSPDEATLFQIMGMARAPGGI